MNRVISSIATSPSVGPLLRACRLAMQALGLSLAIIAYGAVPSTANTQTEVEAQLQELAAPSDSVDLRNRIRGAVHRRLGLAACELSGEFRSISATSRTASDRAPSLSLGLALPLRC